MRHKPVTDARAKNGAGAASELATDPRVFDRVVDFISRTVKRDEVTKRFLILAGLSAFCPSPINVFLKGPSSTGKSYNATEALKVFDDADVWSLGGLSPTALIHDRGDFDEERSLDVVDLNEKTLLFLDAPDPRTLERLRPILSHDKKEVLFKITEKTGKGSLKTKTVILRGFPAAIFCTADASYSEQESTRSFLITPEMSSEKYEAANLLTAEEASTLTEPEDEEARQVKAFFAFLKKVRRELSPIVKVPFAEDLARVYPHDLPRDMRDFKRLINLIQIIAFLHVAQRRLIKVKAGPLIILAEKADYDLARELFVEVIETTRTGLSSDVVRGFFEKVLVSLARDLAGTESLDVFTANKRPLSYQEIKDKYFEVHRRTLSNSKLSYYLEPLEQAGWIDRIPDPADKRKRLVDLVELEPDSRDWLKTLDINVTDDAITNYFNKFEEKWRGAADRCTLFESLESYVKSFEIVGIISEGAGSSPVESMGGEGP